MPYNIHWLEELISSDHQIITDELCFNVSISKGSVIAIIEELGYSSGLGSVVGIATSYGLDGPGDRNLVGARFSAPVQTGSGAHPASYTMGTGFFSGVKSGWGVTLIPYPLLVPRS